VSFRPADRRCLQDPAPAQNQASTHQALHAKGKADTSSRPARANGRAPTPIANKRPRRRTAFVASSLQLASAPSGSCSGVALAAARQAARLILGDVARGLDPAVERTPPRLWEAPEQARRSLSRADVVRAFDSLAAQSLLCAQPRQSSPLVLPGARGVFSGWSKSKHRLDRDSCVIGWTLHDCRSIVAAGLQRSACGWKQPKAS
jgi:hypothetical protein